MAIATSTALLIAGGAALAGSAMAADAQRDAQKQAAKIQEENERIAREQMEIQEKALKDQERAAAEAVAAQRAAAAQQAAAVRASAEQAAQQARESSRAAAMQKATQVNLDAQRQLMLEQAKDASQDATAKVADVDVADDEAPAQRRRKRFASDSNAPAASSLRI